MKVLSTIAILAGLSTLGLASSASAYSDGTYTCGDSKYVLSTESLTSGKRVAFLEVTNDYGVVSGTAITSKFNGRETVLLVVPGGSYSLEFVAGKLQCQ